MIYAIVGTETKGREKAYDELSKLGEISTHVYSEQIETLEPLISATTLFGEKVIVNVIQAMEVTSAKEEIVRLLPQLQESSNIFIIDELLADANRVKQLTKYAKKIFDNREKKEDVDVFTLCNLVARRDKKGAWVEWMRIRDLDSPEAIQGALWWKWKLIWQDVVDGKSSKFTKAECEIIGEKLLYAPIRSHQGKADLKDEIEKVLLQL